MTDKLEKIHLSIGKPLSKEITLKKGEPPTKIEILNTTKIKYSEYWDVSFSTTQFEQMIDNFNKKVIGRGVPINLDHPSERRATTESYGWISSLMIEKEDDETGKMYAKVDWDEDGMNLIKKGKYKYTSVGIYTNFKDLRDGKSSLGFALFELSLTNNPAFTALPEINENMVASYDFLINNKKTNKVLKEDKNKMTEKDNDTATLTRFLKEENEKLKKQNLTLEAKSKEIVAENFELKNKFKEHESKLDKLERTTKLNNLITLGKISPAQRDAAMNLSKESYEGFLQMSELAKEGTINVTKPNVTTLNTNENENSDVQEKVNLMAKERSKKDKISYGEAIQLVLKEDNSLYKEFMEARGVY